MILFWGIALFLGLGACACLLISLFKTTNTSDTPLQHDLSVYRNQLDEVDKDLEQGTVTQDQAEALRLEIKRRMLSVANQSKASLSTPSDGKYLRGGAIGIVILSIGLSFGGYLILGSPDYPDQPLAGRDNRLVVPTGNNQLPPEIANAVTTLENRLRENPNNLEGWTILAQVYREISRYADAIEAYRMALKIEKRPTLLGELGETLFLAQGQVVSPEARAIFEEALVVDPFEYKSRFYIALSETNSGDKQRALQLWADLKSLSPPDAPWLPLVQEHINNIALETKTDIDTIRPTRQALDLLQKYPEKIQPLSSFAPPGEGGLSPREMVGRLADRLKENPDDLEGWITLERSYLVLGETEKAKEARRQIERLEKQAQ